MSFSESDDSSFGENGLPVVEIPTADNHLQGQRRKKLTKSSRGHLLPDSNKTLSLMFSSAESDAEDEFAQDSESAPAEYTDRSISNTLKKKKYHDRGDMTPPGELLATAQKKARIFAKKQKVGKALKELMRCTALARIVYGTGHWKQADAHVNLASGYLLLLGYAAQAQQHTEIAKGIMLAGPHDTQTLQTKHKIFTVLIRLYYILGRAQVALKKYPEAEQNLVKAEALSEERGRLAVGDEAEQADTDIKISIALGRLCLNTGKAALGTSCLEKAVELIQKNYGKDSIELIPVYQDLGKLEQSRGKHCNWDRFIETYIQAHSIAEANYKSHDVEVGASSYALALAYAETQTEEGEISSERYLDKALAIYQVAFGPNHPKTISVQEDLCKLMLRTDRMQDAVKMIKQVISAKTATFGELSKDLSDSYKLLGSIRLSQGEMDKALKHFKKCLAIESAVLGSNHRTTKATRETVEMIMQSPVVSNKLGQTKEQQIQSRPRFSAVVGRNTQLGGVKTAQC